MKKLKKNIFHALASQRKNWLGRRLVSLNQSLSDALNNKINDPKSSGEYWFLEQIDFDRVNVVFDVGANVGNWSLKVNELKSDLEIHAFEPVPNTYNLLVKRTNSIRNFYPNLAALSNTEGVIAFNYYPDSSYFSSAFSNELGKNAVKVEVKTMTGEDYCSINRINQIDFLKIDTEGFESKVLLGLEELFIKQKVVLVQFEYGPMAIDSKFLLKDFYQFFESKGYKVGKIYPNWIDFSKYTKKKEDFVLSNFIAVGEKGLTLIPEVNV